MSLIEEALRRVQEAGRAPERREPPAPLVQPPAPVTRTQGSPLATASRRSRAWRQAVLLGGGTALVVGLVVWRFRTLAGPDVATTHSPSPPVVESTLSPAPQPPLPQPLPQPHLELTGIVEGHGESFAIINGNIMRVGDTLDGATLLEVGGESARVHWGDGELVLRLTQ